MCLQCCTLCVVFVVRDFLDKYGVRVRVLGNIALLPADLQQLIAEGVEMTKHNDRLLDVVVCHHSMNELSLTTAFLSPTLHLLSYL